MTQTEFESVLKKKITKTRLICLFVFLVFLTIGIVCDVLFQNSFDESGKNAEYGYYWGVALGFVISGFTGLLLLIDLILWSYKTISGGGSLITIHRGMLGVYLYVDGELADKVHVFRNYLEGKLSDNTSVNVIFSKYSLRVTFANGQEPIDMNYITRY